MAGPDDFPAAFGDVLFQLPERRAHRHPRRGVDDGELRRLLREGVLPHAHAALLPARRGGDLLLLPLRLSLRLRARQDGEGALARGAVPAGHPALLEQRAGQDLLLDHGVARQRRAGAPGQLA